jgi:membrane protease YdiL (CAAX protease family)
MPTTSSGRDTALFFLLACTITWVLAVPAAHAWLHHEVPSPGAVACAGLSAFGPLLAAFLVARRRRQLGPVFGRWRTSPLWVLVAFLTPLALHAVATGLFVAIGGHPDRWIHPPGTPEAIAALVVFPLGEEFGWRGFAHPRMVERFGLVRGSLVVGAAWGLWHLFYSITPERAGFDGFAFATTMLELPLYAVVLGALFERANRSMAVALAFHAAAHVDHIERAARSDLRLHALHIGVVAVAAVVVAARSKQPESAVFSRGFW